MKTYMGHFGETSNVIINEAPSQITTTRVAVALGILYFLTMFLHDKDNQ